MTKKIFISLLSIPYFNHKEVISGLESLVDGFHIDAMDDHFVKNLAFSPTMIEEITHFSHKKSWLHLMVDNPEEWLNRTHILKKDDRITIHIETIKSIAQTKQRGILEAFKRYGLDVGIAVNPETPLTFCHHLLSVIDHMLIMAVQPGFSGQLFIASMRQKIKKALEHRKNESHFYRIAVDGGITKELFDELTQYGVDDFVLGTALFAPDKDPTIELKGFTS